MFTKYTCFLLFCCKICLAGQFSPALGALQNEKVYNCGLYSAFFVCEYFNKKVNLNELSNALKAGEHWENPVSLLSIKEVIQKKGLKVEAYKDISCQELFAEVNHDKICILHVLSKDSSVGHYYVIPYVGLQDVVVVDAGKKVSKISKEVFLDKIGRKMTGFGLFVSIEQVTKISDETYTLKEDLIDINLGQIVYGQGEILIKLPIVAVEDVTISAIKGNCGCFKGYSIQNEQNEKFSFFEANKKRDLNLIFDRREFGLGDVRRNVLVTSSSSILASHNTLITVKANVIDAESKQIAWFPERLDYGVITEPNFAPKKEIITLILPKEITCHSVKCEHSFIKVTSLSQSTDVGGADKLSRKILQYEVDFTEPPPSNQDFMSRIEFDINSPDMDKIVVPLRWRYVPVDTTQ